MKLEVSVGSAVFLVHAGGALSGWLMDQLEAFRPGQWIFVQGHIIDSEDLEINARYVSPDLSAELDQ